MHKFNVFVVNLGYISFTKDKRWFNSVAELLWINKYFKKSEDFVLQNIQIILEIIMWNEKLLYQCAH